LTTSGVTFLFLAAAAAGLDDEGITALFLSALRDFHERPHTRACPRGGRRERPGRTEVMA
jgi:hypothetical protein